MSSNTLAVLVKDRAAHVRTTRGRYVGPARFARNATKPAPLFEGAGLVLFSSTRYGTVTEDRRAPIALRLAAHGSEPHPYQRARRVTRHGASLAGAGKVLPGGHPIDTALFFFGGAHFGMALGDVHEPQRRACCVLSRSICLVGWPSMADGNQVFMTNSRMESPCGKDTTYLLDIPEGSCAGCGTTGGQLQGNFHVSDGSTYIHLPAGTTMTGYLLQMFTGSTGCPNPNNLVSKLVRGDNCMNGSIKDTQILNTEGLQVCAATSSVSWIGPSAPPCTCP